MDGNMEIITELQKISNDFSVRLKKRVKDVFNKRTVDNSLNTK